MTNANTNYVEEVAQEIRREVPPDALPDGDSEDLFLMYATLALSKGTAVTAEDVHDAWSAWMTSKDPDHESIRPYEELDDQTRREDEPFVNAIRRVAERLNGASA